jgi:hypothetical protein
MKPRLLAGAAVAASLAVLLLAGGEATAERTGRDGIDVSFDASLSPKRLPRQRHAPISLNVSGSIHSSDPSTIPQLSQLEVAFGAGGRLDAVGLSRCPSERLLNATQRQALNRCRPALIGRGSIATEVRLAPERPLTVHASALAFNARSRGRPAIWVHAYSASPPVSFTIPFFVRPARHGGYGLMLRAPIASILGPWPRLRSFHLTLGRRYSDRGARRSYLNGRCPLPPRFHYLSVPIARATFHFAEGPTIASTIHRNCWVRG